MQTVRKPDHSNWPQWDKFFVVCATKIPPYLGGHDALPSPHPTFWGDVSPLSLRGIYATGFICIENATWLNDHFTWTWLIGIEEMSNFFLIDSRCSGQWRRFRFSEVCDILFTSQYRYANRLNIHSAFSVTSSRTCVSFNGTCLRTALWRWWVKTFVNNHQMST